MKSLRRLYEKYKEIANYLIFGVLTTVVSLGVYYGLASTVLDPENPIQLQTANVLSWIAAVTFAYVTNRIFVFHCHDRHIFRVAASYYVARVLTLLMDMGIMFVSVTLLHMNDKIAKLIVQVVVTVANYVFSKLLVFRKKAQKPQPERHTDAAQE